MSLAADVAVAPVPGRTVQTAGSTQNVTAVHPGADEPRPRDAARLEAARLEAARLELEVQVRRFEHLKAQLQATVEQQRNGRPRREILHHSAFARLQAKLESIPVMSRPRAS